MLRKLGFTDEQLRELTARMDPGKPTGLDYYPLPCTFFFVRACVRFSSRGGWRAFAA